MISFIRLSYCVFFILLSTNLFSWKNDGNFLSYALGHSVCDDGFPNSFGRIDIYRKGASALEDLKRFLRSRDIGWVELGDSLFVFGKCKEFFGIEFIELFSHVSFPDPNKLILIKGRHSSDLQENSSDAFQLVFRSYGYSIVQIDDSELRLFLLRTGNVKSLISREATFTTNALVLPFTPNSVLAKHSSNAIMTPHSRTVDTLRSDSIRELVDSIDESSWLMDLEKLASYNRFCLGNDIDSATVYLHHRLQSIGKGSKLDVQNQSFPIGGNSDRRAGINVLATLPAASDIVADRILVIGAHYDSISEKPLVSAPGAEDNAAGIAALLQLAKIFCDHPPLSTTIIFACYSGEELGLYGSAFQAQQLVDEGLSSKVILAHIMDMVAYRSATSPVPQVLLETALEFIYLKNIYTAAAEIYAEDGLETVYSTDPFGSDHVSFIERGMPSLLTIDGDWDKYPSYHRTTDTVDKINVPIAMDILRMNVAALADMMGYGDESFVVPSSPMEMETSNSKSATGSSEASSFSGSSIVAILLFLSTFVF